MTGEAARSLNLKLQILEVLRRDEVGDVIRAARSSQTEALNILSSPFLASVTRDTVAFAAEYRLPGANICDVFCVANAAANSDPSVDTEPSFVEVSLVAIVAAVLIVRRYLRER